MKVGRGDSARALFGAFLVGLLIFIVLVDYAPDSVAFSPNNYGWNGLRDVATAYGVNFTTSVSSLPAKSLLVVSQPSLNFSASDASAIRSFLNTGGTLLLADKSGIGNSLLSKLDSAITIQSQFSISDPTYNWRSKTVPTALVLPGAKSQFGFLTGVTGIALSAPSPLHIMSSKAVALAITSQFSSSVGYASSGQASNGPFDVMAAQRIGNGTLVVVGDPQFLLNSEWATANNKVLIGNLFANNNVFIDASHWGKSSIAQLKSTLAQMLTIASGFPLRYATVLFMLGIGLMLVPGENKGWEANAELPHLLTSARKDTSS